MCKLQKLNITNFLLVFVLAFICCHKIYTQDHNQNAPPHFQVCWVYPTYKLTDLQFASDNDLNIYSALLDGKLISIKGTSGEKRWESDLGGDILSAPLVDAFNVYIAAGYINERILGGWRDTDTLTLRSINKATGVTLWKSEFSNAFLPIEKVYLFSFVNYLIFVGDNGDIYSINKTNGRIIWKKSLNAKLSSEPFVKADRLTVATLSNKVIGLSMYDGRLIENLHFPVSLTTIVESVNENNFILGDGKGLIVSYNKKLKTQGWKFRNGAEISDITFTREGLLVSSSDNYIYMIAEADGKLFWKRRLSGRISDKPQIFGNYIIVAANDDSSAAVLELYGGKLVNRVVLGEDNYFVGGSMRTGNYIIYATLKGILSFSDISGGGCLAK